MPYLRAAGRQHPPHPAICQDTCGSLQRSMTATEHISEAARGPDPAGPARTGRTRRRCRRERPLARDSAASGSTATAGAGTSLRRSCGLEAPASRMWARRRALQAFVQADFRDCEEAITSSGPSGNDVNRSSPCVFQICLLFRCSTPAASARCPGIAIHMVQQVIMTRLYEACSATARQRLALTQ